MTNKEITQEILNKILVNFNAAEQHSSGAALRCELVGDNAVNFKIMGKVIGNTSSEILFNDVCKSMMDISRHVIFDLKECPYLSSFFLGSIMQLVLSHKKLDLKIIFCNVNDIVRDLISIANISNLITVVDTFSEAKEQIKE